MGRITKFTKQGVDYEAVQINGVWKSGVVRGYEQGVREGTPIRIISTEQAKKEILELISVQKELYPSDVAETLNLDYNFVCGVMAELAKENGPLQRIE